MNTLFIGGIILVTLTPLLKKIGRRVVDSENRSFWDEATSIEHRLQQSKDKAVRMYPWIIL